MSESITLTYFNVKALAEPIRLILAVAGVNYEDKRIEREEWPALKESKQDERGLYFVCFVPP